MKKVYLTGVIFICMTIMSYAAACGHCWNSYSNCLTNADIKEFFGVYDETEWFLAYGQCFSDYASCCHN